MKLKPQTKFKTGDNFRRQLGSQLGKQFYYSFADEIVECVLNLNNATIDILIEDKFSPYET